MYPSPKTLLLVDVFAYVYIVARFIVLVECSLVSCRMRLHELFPTNTLKYHTNITASLPMFAKGGISENLTRKLS